MTEISPTTATTDSGVAFPDETDAEVTVSASFIESGNQLQQVFIGLEPVLLVQPEYDADENTIEFVLTAVDLNPQGLVDVLKVLLDAAEEMAKQQADMQQQADEDFDLSNLPETPEG